MTRAPQLEGVRNQLRSLYYSDLEGDTFHEDGQERPTYAGGLRVDVYNELVAKHGAMSVWDATGFNIDRIIDEAVAKFPGIENAPASALLAVVDLAYNTGDSALSARGLNHEFNKLADQKVDFSLMPDHDFVQFMFETMDTTKSGGRVTKGIGKRRAFWWNMLYPRKRINEINTVDGNLHYVNNRNGTANTLMSHKASDNITPASGATQSDFIRVTDPSNQAKSPKSRDKISQKDAALSVPDLQLPSESELFQDPTAITPPHPAKPVPALLPAAPKPMGAG